MIPFADSIKIKRPPWMNWTLIVINIAVFVYIYFFSPDPVGIIQQLGFIPARFFADNWGLFNTLFKTLPLITAQFLHADILHIAGNMLFLGVFGDNIEDRIGHFRYLAFYLLCGIVSLLVHGYVFKGSTLTVIGASGSIAGVMGAFYILYPTAKVKTWLILAVKEYPALLYMGVWFVFNLARGILHIEGLYREPVAWWAHIGGFIAGALLINVFAINPPKSK